MKIFAYLDLRFRTKPIQTVFKLKLYDYNIHYTTMDDTENSL